jgi:PucR family transcriptional regulator, purine catabolism regulatory protein
VTIKVAELLELPHLTLGLLAGSNGLDAVVRWAHVAEVSDPTPWLQGGELILTTGLALPRHPGGQREYLERLADAGAVGLVIVGATAPELTPEVKAMADQLRFPLIEVPLKQPFRAIAEAVYAANASADTERLVEYLRIYGTLNAASAAGLAPDVLLARLGDLTNMRLALVREDGRPQFGAGDPHPRWLDAVSSFDRSRRGAGGLYARLRPEHESPGAYIVQLEAPWSSRIFLIAEGIDVDAMPDLVAVHHIATIMSSQAAAQRAERAVRQKLAAQLLHELVQEALSGVHAIERLQAFGMPTSALVTLVVQVDQTEGGRLADALHDGLLAQGRGALVGTHGSELVVVAALGTDDEDEESLAATVTALTFSALGHSCPTGAGTPGSPAHVSTSYREAMIAVAHASTNDARAAAFARLQAPLAWLPADEELVGVMIERTIGPLILHDQQERSELVRTLNQYLQANGSPSTAARRLHVHRNTLSYRLRKIEGLTGRSLDRMEDCVELWLALRADELRGHRGPTRSADPE